MKKKFILLMMLLAVIGGVSLNSLRAQETITIGSGTEVQAFIPLNTNYDNTISEQIFLAEDFQGKTGSITSYAFKSAKDLQSYSTPITVTRNFKIYMINTDKASFVNATDWVNMTNADLVFNGVVTVQPKDTWTTITFDTPFNYETGKNVILCIHAEGTWNNAVGSFYKHNTTDVRSLVYYNDGEVFDATNITVTSKFDNLNHVIQSQFTFAASGEDPEEPGSEYATTFSFDFENENLSDFTLIDADGDGLNWFIDGNGFDGYKASSQSYGILPGGYQNVALTPDNYLVTNEKYSIVSNSELTFHVACPWEEHYGVAISEDGVNFTTVFEESYTGSGGKDQTVDLSAYAGQNVYIAIRHFNCSNGYFVSVDNLVLTGDASGEEPEQPTAPATPANLAVTATGETTIVLTWDAAEGATSYNVYSGTTTVATALTETTYTVENLTAGTEYCYNVTAVNEAGESEATADVCATTNTAAPVDPEEGDFIVVGDVNTTESTSVAPFRNSSKYSWVETYYPKEELGQAMTITSLAYKSATFNAGTGYTLTADEIEIYIGETDNDNHSSSAVWVPQNELTLVYSGTNILLGEEEWESFTLDTPYEYSGTRNLAIAVSKSASSYNSAMKFASTTVAKANNYRGNDSNAAYADYPAGNGSTNGSRPIVKIGYGSAVVPEVPATPANLAATATSQSTIALTWDAVEGATEYNIYSGTETVATVTTNSYNATGLTAGTEYCYSVTAVNVAGESEASEEACATPTEAEQSEYALYADFENATLDGWRLIDADGDGVNWKLSTGNGGIVGVGGSNCIYSESWVGGSGINPDNYIVTTATFAITEGSVLEWDVLPNNYQFCEEHYGVVYSTDGEFFYTIWEETLTSSYEYEHRTLELDYIAGQTVYIGFRHYMCTDNDAVCIDNIALSLGEGGEPVMAAGDTWQDAVEVTEYPFAHTPDFANLNNDYTLPGDEQDGKDVVYKLTFAEETTFSASVTGANGKVALYAEDFNGGENPGADNYYGASEDPEQPVDPEQPTGATTFSYDFNDNLMTGWNTIDGDGDGENWMVGYTYAVDGFTPCIYSQSYTYTTLTPNNYVYTVDAYSILETSVLSYDVRLGNTFWPDEYYGVAVSENGTDFTMVFEEAANSLTTATNRTIDLSAYAGKNIHIAFRHFNCSGNDAIAIDNVVLSTGSKRNRANAIDNMTVPAGTYYLVASATEAFSVNINIVEEQESDLTPVAQVTATENGANVDVAWTTDRNMAVTDAKSGKSIKLDETRDPSDYTFHSYNVYRVNGDNEPIVLAENLTETTYQDATWAEAEAGSYKWGVAALYTANAKREEVTLINEGFEVGYYTLPEGWTTYSDPATANQYGNFNSYSSLYSDITAYAGAYSAFTLGGYAEDGSLFYLVTPALDLSSTLNPTLNFHYVCPEFWGSVNTLSVKYGTSPTGPWTDVWTGETTSSWLNETIDLSECAGNTIYVAFCSVEGGGWGVGVDNVVVKGTATDGPIPVASEIVWSNAIDKDMTTTVDVEVVAADGASVAGTTVRLENVNEPTYVYETTLDATGQYTWTDFRKGTYEVTIALEGYNSCANGEIMEIMDATTIECTLELKPELVEGLYVSPTGWAMWTVEGSAYDVVFEGETVANDITDKFFQLNVTGLTEGEEYTTTVIVDNSTTEAMEYTWTYRACDNFAGVVNLAATMEEGTATLTWTLPVYENQDPIYEFASNFDDGSLNGWNTIDADGDARNWQNTSEHANQGFGINNTYCASSSSYDNSVGALTPDNYLVTDVKYTITEGSTLTYSVCGQSNTYYEEHYGVAISTTNGTDAAAFTTIFEETLERGEVEQGSIQTQWFERTIDLSDYAGQAIYIAFRHFNCTDQWWINLDNVELSNPTRDEEGEWLTYDNGVNESAMGFFDYVTGEPQTMYWAIMFPADVISQYAGTQITKVSMYVYEGHTGGVSIHTGGDYAPGTTVHVQEYEVSNVGQYEEIELTTPITISGTENVWIQFSNTTGGFVAAHSVDCGEANGRWMSNDGITWYDANWYGEGWYGTWQIRAYVEGDANPIPDEPEQAEAEVLGVMLYRNGELLTEQPLNAESYTDADLAYGNYEYDVRVVYGGEDPSTHYAMSCAETVEVSYEAEPFEIVAPYDLTGEATYNDDGTYGVTLEWVIPYCVYDHFNIYRRVAGGTYEKIAETESLTYYDEVNADGTYYYQVTSFAEVDGVEYESEPATAADGSGQNFVEITLTSIEENGVQGLTIYPNPTKDNLTISAENMTRITITNTLGQVIFDQQVSSDNEMINMSQYEAGVYMVRITTENGVAVERITVL